MRRGADFKRELRAVERCALGRKRPRPAADMSPVETFAAIWANPAYWKSPNGALGTQSYFAREGQLRAKKAYYGRCGYWPGPGDKY